MHVFGVATSPLSDKIRHLHDRVGPEALRSGLVAKVAAQDLGQRARRADAMRAARGAGQCTSEGPRWTESGRGAARA